MLNLMSTERYCRGGYGFKSLAFEQAHLRLRTQDRSLLRQQFQYAVRLSSDHVSVGSVARSHKTKPLLLPLIPRERRNSLARNKTTPGSSGRAPWR